MTVDVKAPVGPWGRLTQMGNPYHGRVDYAPATDTWSVTLPNAEVRPYRLYGNIWAGMGDMGETPIYDVMTPYNGSNQLFDRGMPAVVRSEAQTAADVAAGIEWRNKAIIHPPNIGATSLSGTSWLWCDSTGARWLVDVAWNLGAGGVATVTLKRFGAFGKPATTYTKSKTWSLASIGQDSPALPVEWSHPGDWFHSANKIGSQAIFRLGYRPTSAADAVYLLPGGSTAGQTLYYQPFLPVGFVRFSMSGVPDSGTWDITLDVLATRAQTLGSDATQTWPTTERYAWDFPLDSTEVIEGNTKTVTTTRTMNSHAGSAIDGTGLTSEEARIGKQGWRFDTVGRVLSKHFEGDAVVTISLDYWRARTWERSETQTVGGSIVSNYTRADAGSPWVHVSTSGSIVRDINYSVDEIDRSSLTLKRDGVAVWTHAAGYERDETQTGQVVDTSSTRTASGSATGYRRVYALGAQTDLWLPAMYGPSGGTWLPLSLLNHPTAGVVGHGYEIPNTGTLPDFVSRIWEPILRGAIRGPAPTGEPDAVGTWTLIWMPYAADCYGYIARATNGSNEAMVFSEVTTPSGTQPGIPLAQYNATTRPPLWLSHNPVTGDVVRSGWPVNWV